MRWNWIHSRAVPASLGMAGRYTYLLVLIGAPALLFVMLYGNNLVPVTFSQTVKTTDLPIVEYDIETARETSKARKEIDRHFKGVGNPDSRKPITELPQEVEPLPTNSHWWIGLSTLPAEQSDSVVLGDIVGREAHLSDDRTGIYSEFTLQIDQVFKDATGTASVGGSLRVDRIGGAVRFSSGRVQKYGLTGQGMPFIGSRYVLFLRKTAESDLLILTGYELSSGKVIPLDGEDSIDPRRDLPFAKYRGSDQTSFIKDLLEAVARPVGAPQR